VPRRCRRVCHDGATFDSNLRNQPGKYDIMISPLDAMCPSRHSSAVISKYASVIRRNASEKERNDSSGGRCTSRGESARVGELTYLQVCVYLQHTRCVCYEQCEPESCLINLIGRFGNVMISSMILRFQREFTDSVVWFFHEHNIII